MNDLTLSLQQLTPAQRRALTAVLAKKGIDIAERLPIPHADRARPLPLTGLQQRLWFLWRLDPDSPAYNIAGALELDGELDPARLQEALRALVQRHESLRTRLYEDAQGTWQRIDDSGELLLEQLDLTAAPERAAAQREAFALRPFDLERGPLLRVQLLRLAASRQQLLVSLHHVVADGVSVEIFLRELAALYAEPQAVLPALPLQFADYAHWQQERLAAGDAERQRQWWRDYLGAETPVLQLPLDHPRPAQLDTRGARLRLRLEAPAVAALRQRAQAQGLTLPYLLLGGFMLLLQRHAGQRDVRLGMPVAGRTRAETSGLIGCFVNTLVLRAPRDPGLSLGTFLATVQREALEAQTQGELPLERLCEISSAERGATGNGPFQVLFNHQRRETWQTLAMAGLNARLLDDAPPVAKFDLALDALEQADGRLDCEFTYALALFEDATVARLLADYQAVLGALLETSWERSVADFGWLTLPELHGDAAGRWSRSGIVGRIVAQAERQPERAALLTEQGQLGYAELHQRSERLAAALWRRGLRVEERVAVALPRSLELPTALLAVLKAGGAYVPLDIDYPRERLAYLLQDCGAHWVLTSRAVAGCLPLPPGVQCLAVEELVAEEGAAPQAWPDLHPGQLAYVIYTSGSTGQPKGVAVAHGELDMHCQAIGERYDLSPADRELLFMSFAFDGVQERWLATLAHGGSLVLRGDELWTPEQTQAALQRFGVTVAAFPPAYLQQLAEHAERVGWAAPVRIYCFGGDAVPEASYRQAWQALRPQHLINGYGPTETVITPLLWKAQPNQPCGAAYAPIGSAVGERRLYILDADLQPVPFGVAGELHIGGPGLARGYLKRPGLTAERFIADPFLAGGRMYRTGDRVRQRADGALDYLGRLDGQLKIRGFRIESGEVEAQLRQLPGVREAVVDAVEGTQGRYLAAYVTALAGATLDGRALREALRLQLPDYQVPSQILVLDALPLSPNGKVDRRLLPAPASTMAPREAPRGALEIRVAALWQELLELPALERTDDFFDLGGHSLLATRLVARLKFELELECPLRWVFETPVFADFVQRLATPPLATAVPPLRRLDDDRVPVVSPAQSRLWFLWRLDPASAAYNIPAALRLQGPLALDALERTFSALVARHESLRTLFGETDGQVRPRLQPAGDQVIAMQDLRVLEPAAREWEVTRLAREEALRPFDLERGPLLRLQLLRLDEQEHVLLLTLHHIAADGWSLAILIEEFATAYSAYAGGEKPDFAPLPVRYADFAHWQQALLAGDEGQRQLDYWTGRLGEVRHEPLRLPTDRPRPAVQSLQGASLPFTLDAQEGAALRQLARTHDTTLFTVLLAAFQAVLARYSGQSEISVAVPVANRTRQELERVVGFFVNTQVLRCPVRVEEGFDRLLGYARQAVQEAQANQDLPFEQLVEALQPERSLAHNPLVQVKFNFGFDLSELPSPAGLRLSLVDEAQYGARFDLALDLAEAAGGEGLKGAVTYATDLFDEASIQALAAHFRGWLRALAAAPTRPLRELAVPGAVARLTGERLALAGGSWLQAFAHWCHQTPGAVALRDARGALSYAELDAATARLAQRLVAAGVARGQRVGVCLPRGRDWIIALLAVHRAGAVCVALDPRQPVARLRELLDESGAVKVLVADVEQGAPFAERSLSVTALAADAAPLAALATPAAGEPAYVVFTSGSTGRPKGVLVSHGALLNYTQALARRLEPQAGECQAMLSSVAADLGYTTVFGALTSGGCLFLPDDETVADAERLAQELAQAQVAVLKIVPGHLGGLLAAAPEPRALLPRRLLVLGGEACAADLLDQIRALAPELRIVNHYGPTEATVGVLTHEWPTDARAPAQLPVGRPLANTRVCLLDAHLAAVPPGMVGELYIGGAGLAVGYLGQPGLTAERFVADPDRSGERLYRTGDRARLNASGAIEFLGRVDDQVKIRGYRVEPAELARALASLPGIADAWALAERPEGQPARLLAYCVAPGQRVEALRQALAKRLPEQLLPAQLNLVERIPRTANGKVDRQALVAATTAEAQAPATVLTPLERQLADVWQQVLKRESLGPDDNFFELGGDSILSLQIVARLRKLGHRLTPRQLFESQTVRQLARRLDAGTPPEAVPSALEGQLAAIWQQVLKREQVGLDDNFFELGGDSILSLQIVARVRKLGYQLTPRQLFERQTLRQLAQALDGTQTAPTRPQGISASTIAPTPIQARFFAEVPAPLRQRWNQSILLTPREPLQWSALLAALRQVLARHLVLNLVFAETAPWLARAGQPQAVEELLWIREAADTEAFTALLDEAQGSLNIHAGPLLRLLHLRLADGSERLLLVIHHLVVDAVSWRVLLEELQQAYRQALTPTGSSHEEGTEGSSFAEWSAQLQRLSGSPELIAELPYWQACLQDAPCLPVGDAQAPATWAEAAEARFALDATTTRRLLEEAGRAYRTRINDLLLTALGRALGAWSGQAEALVQLEGHGREQPSADTELVLDRTLGWFTSLYPVRLPGHGERLANLKAVKERLRQVPRGGIGYGVLRYLSEQGAALAALPQPSLTFNYLGQLDQPFSSEALFSLAPESPGRTVELAAPLGNRLTLTGQVLGGRLGFTLSYSAVQYASTDIAALLQLFQAELEALVALCLDTPRGLTPSDVPLAGLDQQQLDRLPLSLADVVDLYPLSPLQQGLLFHALDRPGDGLYVNQLAVTLEGLDADPFMRAWRAVQQSHAILRSGFLAPGGVAGLREPLQWVARAPALPVTLLDWRERDVDESALEQLAQAQRAEPFDLAQPPLQRLALVRLDEQRYRLIWTCHHLLLDGWSSSRLLGEVLAHYDGRTPAVPAGQFRDYIAWLQAQDAGAGTAFWQARLADLDGATRLADALPAPLVERTDEPVEPLNRMLELTTTQRLQAFAQARRVTLNTLLQAAWILLLQRHTGQAQVCFGATVAGRPASLPAAEELLGLFINTLPIVQRPAATATLGEWLPQLQAYNLEIREHEQVPLHEIQRLAGHAGQGLFDTLLVFENFPLEAALASPHPRLRIGTPSHVDGVHYPLALIASAGERLLLRYSYRAERFSRATVQRLATAFEALLTQLPDLVDQPLGELCLLDATERQAQVAARNQTAVAYPRTPLLPTLLAEQARRSPGALAVVHGARRLDYATFDAEANRLAHWLIAQGVGPDVRVGVAAERSVELVLALVAVLKAGGAYVPLDPDHPAERLAYQLEDSQVRLLLTQGHLRARLPASAVPQLLLDDRTAWQDQPAQAPTPALHGEHLAYVLYTSGSTGRPKGAGNTQAALLNRLQWMQDAFALGEGRRVLQKTPFSFDVSVWEFFWPLLTGATLVVADPGAHRDPRALREVIVAEEVQVLHFVPSMLQAFLAAGELARCPSLEQVICSGEALPRELQQAFHQSHGAELHNLYGPTEAAIDVSHWPCTAADEGLAVPIGRPIANLRLLVLDPWLAPVPEGVTGELYIGGAGLARGYHGRPGLTAERFIADPFEPGARLYRTGDLARWRADGALDYLGRIDHQVKIRGQRLELGEIEARLRAHPAVEDAVVVARAGEGGLQLVGYVTGVAVADELRGWLREALPDYMVPAQVLVLEAMPLSANGKLDRKALPEPDPSQSLRPYRAPTSAAERTLAPLWQRLLGVERVGLDDNFFELGGDSILSLQLVNQARQAGLEIAPRQVFELPTLAALAAAATLPQETPAAAPAQRFALLTAPLPADLDTAALDDAYPLSPMQRGMLFHVLDEPTAGLYVNQLSVCVEGLDNARFAAAWQAAVARHAVLRTAFVWEGLRDPIQVVRRQARLALREIDGRRHAPDLAALAAEERARPFDLGRPPLQRLTLVRLDERRQQLIWTSHHLLLDGWSAASLISEVLQAYAGEALPEVPGRYADYLAWLARQDAAAAQAFWQQRLAGATPTLLAESLPRPLGGAGHGLTFTRLDAQATQALQRFARAERLTLNTLIQGAWLLLLQRYTGRSRVIFGSTVAGRPAELPGMEEVLGLFINTLPVAQVVDEHRRVGDWLREVQQENARLRDFEHSPLYDIQRWAGQGGQALFDSIIVFENYPVDVALRQRTGAGLSFGPLQVKDETSVPMDLAVRLGETLEIEYQYLRSHFAAAAVERIRANLEHLLFALAAAAERSLGEIEALGAGEQAALARLQGEPWRDSATSLAPQAILAQARRRPAVPVLGDPERRLSWGELDERSGRLASWLQGQGVGAESRVAVALRRGVDWPVTLLAIWRAGGAYVPLDASYPAERLSYQLADAGAALLLTESALVERLPEVAGTPRVCLDHLDLATCSPCPVEPQLGPEHLAYVIYTSGSTGRPKGVAVAHGALAMHGRAIGQRYALDEGTHELLFMSFAFDGAHERWIAPLMHGGRLFIRGEELWTPERTLEVLAQEAIDVAAFPPVYLQQLVAQVARSGNPPPMRIYCFGGEAVPEASFREAQRVLGAAHLVNGYGPTETVVTPLLWKAAPDDACGAAYAPIGQAVGERRLYILDEALEPVPLGVVGELYIGGRGLARGYLGRPAATAERFVADPFTSGGRLYRTGDLVRGREDGLIDYVGRLDHQVKIRGFRVELGEIEACLLEHPQVREAVVDARAALSGRQLVGYVVGEADLCVLKGWLRERLPEHLVPAQLVALERLPLTPGGKVDRRALPEPERVQDAYQAPRNELERQLATLWQEVLQVELVGITDNFFELGGDSILSLQLVSRIRETLGEGLPLRLRDLLQQQTISGLLARQPEQTQVAHTELSPEGTDFGLLPIQQWLFEHNTAEPNHYNQAVLLACREPLRADCLEQALRLLLERHASLRLAFRERAAGQWVQRERSMAELAPAIVEEPLLWQRQAVDEDAALAVANQAQRSLDLASGRLLRAVLIDAAGREQRLLLVIHHLGVDGVSWRILLDELQRLYLGLARGEPTQLPTPSSSYRSWVRALGSQAQGAELTAELPYWLDQLAGEVVDPPRDNPRGRASVAEAENVSLELSAEQTQALLKRAPQAHGTQINDLLLAALSRVLCRWLDSESVLIALEGHGREDLFGDLDLSRTLGWFTSLFPVRLTPGAGGLATAIPAIRDQLAAIPNRGLGFGVLRYLGAPAVQAQLRDQPQARITFNYLGQFDQSFASDAPFRPLVERAGDVYSPQAPLGNWLEIVGQVYGGRLRLRCLYSRRMFRHSTVERLMQGYREELLAVLEHCLAPAATRVAQELPA